MRSLLKVVGRVSVTQPTWPVNVDLSDVVKDLPRLQLMDKERENKEELENREKRKRLKEGNHRRHENSIAEGGSRRNGRTL